MESEAPTISARAVHVTYVLRNAGAADFAKTYCVNAATMAALRRVLTAKPPEGYGESYLAATTVDYALKTGANRAGPIRHFKLTLDRSDAQGGDAHGHAGPERFETRRENFTPTDDLHILFLAPVPADPFAPK